MTMIANTIDAAPEAPPRKPADTAGYCTGMEAGCQIQRSVFATKVRNNAINNAGTIMSGIHAEMPAVLTGRRSGFALILSHRQKTDQYILFRYGCFLTGFPTDIRSDKSSPPDQLCQTKGEDHDRNDKDRL